MSTRPLRHALVLAGLLVSACGVSTPATPGSDSRAKVEQWLEREHSGLTESGKPSNLQIPLVEFGGLSAAFGKATWSSGPRGQYEVSHDETTRLAQGECYGLSVFGTAAPGPVLKEAPSALEPGRPGELDESPRTWSTVQVRGLNRSLRYHLGASAFGDANSTWKSEPFTVVTPDGRTGSYQATVECENAAVAAAMFSKLTVPPAGGGGKPD